MTTQTGDGFCAAAAKVEVSTDGLIWSDISGSSSSVAPADQERISGEAYTHRGDNAIVTEGKRKPLEIEVMIVYTEGASDPFEAVRTAFNAEAPYWVRWTPKGEGLDNTLFYTDAGVITGLIYPEVDASSADPCMFGFTLFTPKVNEAYLIRMLLEDGSGHWLMADGSVACWLVAK